MILTLPSSALVVPRRQLRRPGKEQLLCGTVEGIQNFQPQLPFFIAYVPTGLLREASLGQGHVKVSLV